MIARPLRTIESIPAYVGPFGYCIYCGAKQYDPSKPDRRLADEHAIPFSLGGGIVLREASCARCEAITSAFEGTVARSVLGPIRIHYELPTRNKRSRPDRLPVTLVFNDRQENRDVPINEHPPICAVIAMNRPRLIANPDLDDLGEKQIIVNSPLGIEYNQYLIQRAIKKYGAKNAIFSSGVGNRLDWGRQLAKSAYAYALACVNKPENIDWFIGKLILNKDTESLKLYVGRSIYGITQKFDVPTVHHFQFRHFFRGRQKFLVVTIRLFVPFGLPAYDVVVGRIYKECSITEGKYLSKRTSPFHNPSVPIFSFRSSLIATNLARLPCSQSSQNPARTLSVDEAQGVHPEPADPFVQRHLAAIARQSAP